MRPDSVVLRQPLLVHFSSFPQAGEEIEIQDDLPIGAVEALDVGVLRQLARLDEVQQHVVLFDPAFRLL